MIMIKLPDKINQPQIFFWIDGDNIYKAQITKRRYNELTLVVYLNNKLILRRIGLNKYQMYDILHNIMIYGLKIAE